MWIVVLYKGGLYFFRFRSAKSRAKKERRNEARVLERELEVKKNTMIYIPAACNLRFSLFGSSESLSFSGAIRWRAKISRGGGLLFSIFRP